MCHRVLTPGAITPKECRVYLGTNASITAAMTPKIESSTTLPEHPGLRISLPPFEPPPVLGMLVTSLEKPFLHKQLINIVQNFSLPLNLRSSSIKCLIMSSILSTERVSTFPFYLDRFQSVIQFVILIL